MKEMPIGFLMTLAENERAMRYFATLSPQQRDAIVMQASRAASREEMQEIVQSLDRPSAPG